MIWGYAEPSVHSVSQCVLIMSSNVFVVVAAMSSNISGKLVPKICTPRTFDFVNRDEVSGSTREPVISLRM